MNKHKKITLSLLVIYLIILSWIILLKTQFSLSTLGRFRSINLIPFAKSSITNGKIDLNEILNNILVFIPVGVYIGMLTPAWSFIRKTAPVTLLSFTYETLQFLFALGASDITDLITNTLGGILGILIVMLFFRLFCDKAYKILNTFAIICTIVIIGFLVLIISYNQFL